MKRQFSGLLPLAFVCFLIAIGCLQAAPIELPTDAVGWWRAGGDNRDFFGNGSTTVPGGAAFAPGEVGKAFSFTGQGLGVSVGTSPKFNLHNLTIEAWVKRATRVAATRDGFAGTLFGGGPNSYCFLLEDNGLLSFAQIGIAQVSSSTRITDTDWHHVAVTKNGGAVVFYIDGAVAGNATYNPTFTFGTRFAVGSFGEPVNAFNYSFWGLIDELTLYSRALSGAEIGAVYHAGSDGKNAEDISLTVSVPKAVRVNSDFHTRFLVKNEGLHAASNILVNLSLPAGYTLTTNTATKGANVVTAESVQNSVDVLPPGESYAVTLTGKKAQPGSLSFHGQLSRGGAALNSADAQVTVSALSVYPPEGIVAWWRAEGNNDDTVGNGSTDIPGGANFAPGVVGQAFSFPGAVNVGNPTAFHLQDFTLEGWIQRAGPLTPASVIFAGANGSYGIAILSSGEISLSKVNVDAVTSKAQIRDANWHHVAVSKSGTDVEFYIDGALADSAVYDTVFTFDGSFTVGSLGTAVFDGSSHTYFPFYGQIDELSLYNRVLTADEIGTIFGATTKGKSYENIALGVAAPPIMPPDTDFSVAFTVVNTGLQASANVELNLALPPGFTLVKSTTTQGANVVTGTALQNALGVLLPGDSATVTLTGHASTLQKYVFNGQVSCDGYDLSLADDEASVGVQVIGDCLPSDDSLLVLLRGEGNADDFLGHSTSAVLPAYAPGLVGQALRFDGATEVDVADSSDLDVTSFTVEAWVYPTLLDGSFEVIASKQLLTSVPTTIPYPHDVDVISSQFALGIRGAFAPLIGGIPEGNLAFFISGMAGLPVNYGGGWADAGATVPLNQWTHVALTVATSTVTLYVNGEVTARFAGLTGSPALNQTPLRVGGCGFVSGTFTAKDSFNGLIDELSYYSQPLSGVEIANIFRVGSMGKCSSPIAPVARVNARPVTTPDGPAIELSWPSALVGAMLEKTDTVGGGNWSPVGTTPTVIDGQNKVRLPLSGTAAYFHLKLP